MPLSPNDQTSSSSLCEERTCSRPPGGVAWIALRSRISARWRRASGSVQVLGVESHGVRLFREILTAQVEHDLMVQALIHHSVMAGAPGGDLEREVQQEELVQALGGIHPGRCRCKGSASHSARVRRGFGVLLRQR